MSSIVEDNALQAISLSLTILSFYQVLSSSPSIFAFTLRPIIQEQSDNLLANATSACDVVYDDYLFSSSSDCQASQNNSRTLLASADTYLTVIFGLISIVMNVSYLVKRWKSPLFSFRRDHDDCDLVDADNDESEETKRDALDRQREKILAALWNYEMTVEEDDFDTASSQDGNLTVQLPHPGMCRNGSSNPFSRARLSTPKAKRDMDTRSVSASCCICLSDYCIGDRIAWSSNVGCIHHYHSDCLANWYCCSSQQQHHHPSNKQMSCPCCRQLFSFKSC